LSVFPFEVKDDGKVVLACAVVPDRHGILELEEALHGPVEFRLARRAEVALALRHGYARLKPAHAPKIPFSRGGQELVEYRPLGELLIDMGAITYPNLLRAVSHAGRSGKRLGEFLVAQGLIRPDQIEAALARQQLGEARFAQPSVLGTPAMLAKPVLAERISSNV
jgi:hypothetical protein